MAAAAIGGSRHRNGINVSACWRSWRNQRRNGGGWLNRVTVSAA